MSRPKDAKWFIRILLLFHMHVFSLHVMDTTSLSPFLNPSLSSLFPSLSQLLPIFSQSLPSFPLSLSNPLPIFFSFFQSSEENLETVLSAVLQDPLESSMEGIEDLATGILRTGKLSVQGEAGGLLLTKFCTFCSIEK